VSVRHRCMSIAWSTMEFKRCILTHRLVGKPRQRSAAPISPQRGPRAMRSNLIVLTLTRTSGHNLGVFRRASSATQARLHRTSHLARRRDIFITAAIVARNSGPSPAQHLEEARCHVGRRWLVDAVAIARRMAILAGRDRAGEARQPWAMGCRARMDERCRRDGAREKKTLGGALKARFAPLADDPSPVLCCCCLFLCFFQFRFTPFVIHSGVFTFPPSTVTWYPRSGRADRTGIS